MDEKRVLLVTTREIGEDERSVYYREMEIRSLVENLGLLIVYQKSFTLKDNIFGKGQMEEIAEIARAVDASSIVVDTFLSPREEERLETIVERPVSDREEIILMIFAQNAHSKEAVIQTKKARLLYLKPRLVFRNASYSQQRGGVRGSKGEGEKEIELRRRSIESEITKLDRELCDIKRIRETQQKKRLSSSIPSFALLGYTNSGKTTILNYLSANCTPPEDKLFATLDTTSRSFTLPSGRDIIVSDTVGFIRDLPPSLIEAFSSTLEEALNSSGIIIVADASHPDAVKCLRVTLDTISSLGGKDKIKLVVLNKIDSPTDDISLSALRSSGYKTIETSFKDGKGIEDFIASLDEITSSFYIPLSLILPFSSPLFAHLSKEEKIKSVEYLEDGIKVECEVKKEEKGRYTPYICKE